MRWRDLFSDLEAQAVAAEARELAGEVADRTRRETALVGLVDRLGPVVGHPVALQLPVLRTVRGTLVDTGPDWLLLDEDGGRQLLVPLAAVVSVTGVGPYADQPAGEVGKRLDLRWALRGLTRDRAGVALVLVDGTVAHGTPDRVGADHLDLAEHAPGEPRRASAVRQVRVVPLAAVVAVRSST